MSSDLQIITNHHPRAMWSFYDMPESIQQTEFDYVTDELGKHSPRFFKYRGEWYDAQEFMVCRGIEAFEGWHGYQSDSFFSGILIKLTEDGEQVIPALYLS